VGSSSRSSIPARADAHRRAHLGRDRIQKAIVVGHAGHMIKAIGTAARRELERELATRVYLALRVDVRRRWRTDDALLDRLGLD